VYGDADIRALTRREREVAELITERLTNPQIAERLVLSRKTVEVHASNIFRKLGVSSRGEVARAFERATGSSSRQ
jgi:DNA-binding NarL/FixJ family response regulator